MLSTIAASSGADTFFRAQVRMAWSTASCAAMRSMSRFVHPFFAASGTARPVRSQPCDCLTLSASMRSAWV